MTYKKPKKKVKRKVDSVIAHVKSTFNNTMLSVTDMTGNVLMRGSSGALGFKGTRKGTPFAATQVATNVGRELRTIGVRTAEVNMQGPGSGKDSVVRGLQASGINITVLRDVTPMPHNGPRPPKRRRV